MIWFDLWPARIDLCSGPHLIEFLIEWRRIECWPARVDLWSGPNWNKEGGNGQFELVAAEGMWSEREAFAAFHRVSWGGGGHGGCFFRGKQQYWRRSTLIWIVNLKELSWAMTCSDWPLARTTLNWNVKRSTLIWPDLNFGSVGKTFGQIPSELSFDPLGLTFAQDHTELNFDFN